MGVSGGQSPILLGFVDSHLLRFALKTSSILHLTASEDALAFLQSLDSCTNLVPGGQAEQLLMDRLKKGVAYGQEWHEKSFELQNGAEGGQLE